MGEEGMRIVTLRYLPYGNDIAVGSLARRHLDHRARFEAVLDSTTQQQLTRRATSGIGKQAGLRKDSQ